MMPAVVMVMQKHKRFSFLLLLFALCQIPLYAQTDFQTIIANVQQEQWAGVVPASSLDSAVAADRVKIGADGKFSDITDYNKDTSPVSRIRNFALAYTLPQSAHYRDASLYSDLVSSLTYWDTADPGNSNWWYGAIHFPQKLGEILILMKAGMQQLPSALQTRLINQMPATVHVYGATGANLTDQALHFVYRGALLADSEVIKDARTRFLSTLNFTTGEGLQYDYSMHQHSNQAQLASYGQVWLSGGIRMGLYLQNTRFKLSADDINILSVYARNTYLKILRGRYSDFNSEGRGITRRNVLGKSSTLIRHMKTLDPAHAVIYEQAIARIDQHQPADYQMSPYHKTFYRSDYTVYNGPAYMFNVRSVSTRTVRTEGSVNNENLNGRYLCDGSTPIMVNGNEYDNLLISDKWEWDKLPGVTCRDLADQPRNYTTYGKPRGVVDFSGGVSDGAGGVHAYELEHDNVSGKKSWFFLGEEVVCLGAGITSAEAENLTTTVNQCHLDGSVRISKGGTVSIAAAGPHRYNNTAEWILHDSVGYFFPKGGNLYLNNHSQSGTNIFKLWFSHGVHPSGASYAYIVTPGKKTVAEMKAYKLSDIEILQNDSNIQAVKHRRLGIVQVVFWKAGTFRGGGVKVTADNQGIVMLKNFDTAKVTVSIADPSQQNSSVTLLLDLPGIPGTRQLKCNLPAAPHLGASKTITVDENT